MSDPADNIAHASVHKDLTGRRVGRFAIRVRLGGGGMGEVYRAEDTTLKRTVALKRMTPELRADPRYRERFLKEAERASALNSPGVAGIYDVLEERGELFLVMEFVEGATLRQRLQEPLGLREFLQVAIQCVEAMAAAHEKNIIHCDLKPENIMLTPAGRVKVLDFGVAKQLLRPDAATVDSLASRTATVRGTPYYMAPEVLLEEGLDQRADIFSLGVVFYEALSGQHPFRAASFMGTCDRILHQAAPPLGQLNPRVPAELERIVTKMLAKDPAERYATAADLLVDLRGVERALPQLTARAPRLPGGRRRPRWALLAAPVLLVALGAVPLVRRLTPSPLPEQKNLVVLPFQAAGGGPEDQARCAGLTETVTAKLARVRSLQVPLAAEVRTRKVQQVESARTELGANLALQGDWWRKGERVSLDLSLLDARSGRPLRQSRFEVGAGDMFALEDRVLRSVLGMLEVKLTPQEAQELTSRGARQPLAYDQYLRGRAYLQDYARPESIEKAAAAFRHALQLDPRYALFYAGLGEAYWHKYRDTQDSQWVREALSACERAVALEGGQAYGHICLGQVYTETGKYEQAVAQFDRALRLEPSDEVYRGLATAYQRLGRLEEAERTYRRAVELRPQYWAGYNWLGVFYFGRGLYREAADMFAKVVELAPDNFRGYNNLAAIYLIQGRYAEAVTVAERSAAIRPTARAWEHLATAYFYLREYSQSARTYQRAIQLDDRDYTMWGNLGDAYYWAPGMRSQAAGAFQKAISLGRERLQVNPRDADLLAKLARYHAMLGERRPAFFYLSQALALAPANPEVRFKAAQVHNLFGENGQALDWLQKALAVLYSPTKVRDDPIFENVHANPRFQKLIREQESSP